MPDATPGDGGTSPDASVLKITNVSVRSPFLRVASRPAIELSCQPA